MSTYSVQADELLGLAEAIMLELVEPRVGSVESTRWHWDAPDAMVTWADSEGAGRNLHMILNDPPRDSFLVEINAWKDFDKPERWRKGRSETLPGTYVLSELLEVLEQAFDHVSRWDESDLTSVVKLAGGTA